MTDNGYTISTQRNKIRLQIFIEGVVVLSTLNNLRDDLIQKIEGYPQVTIVLKQQEEISFALLQLLIAVKDMPGNEVSLQLETAEEHKALLRNAGLADLLEIK